MMHPFTSMAQARLSAADRERRSGMARLIAVPYSGLMFLGVAGRVAVFIHSPTVNSLSFEVGNSIALTLILGMFIWAAVAAQRRNPDRAALLVSLGSLAAPLVYQAQVIGETNLSFAIIVVGAAYLNAIMAAGIIGARGLLLQITVLAIAISFLVFIVLPRHATISVTIDASTQSVLFITAALTLVSGFLIMWAGGRGYARVQQQLVSAEVQVAFAQQIDEAKNLFIANVNHELRNPIMAIRYALMSAKESLVHDQGSPAAVLVDTSLGIITRLTDLVNSILEASGIGHQRLLIQTIPLLSTVREAVQMVPSPEPRDVRLAIPADLAVRADVTALRQIVTNLVSNALKYSPDEMPVLVDAGTDGVGRVAIRVRDRGLGIPPEQLSMLFQQFVRLPRDIESSVPGNGVGLYMCRVLAEGMGGSVAVESNGVAGDGSTFILHLPAAAPV